ncbi:hypothetical protein NI25_17630 [Streptomyces sp. CCM_MD2014]|nr:hypothetical protein NI25_17630 [Streptomyces sp. CCM_MD2014]
MARTCETWVLTRYRTGGDGSRFGVAQALGEQAQNVQLARGRGGQSGQAGVRSDRRRFGSRLAGVAFDEAAGKLPARLRT